LQQLASTGNPPRIASLSSQLLYPLRADQERRLPLTATTDADASHLYWFVNDAFVGKTGRDEALFWEASIGTHNVLAVDDMGRSDSLQLTVATAH
jgi:penicillin-binding protein 1C